MTANQNEYRAAEVLMGHVMRALTKARATRFTGANDQVSAKLLATLEQANREAAALWQTALDGTRAPK